MDLTPTNADWSLWMVQTLNGHAAAPTFTAPVLASEHFIHRGSVQTLLGGQCGNRALGDYLQLRTGPQGEAQIAYADSNNIIGAAAGHAMYVRQNGGDGLLASLSPVNLPGLTPFNGVSDPSGDGKYEVNGTSSASMPQLDILSSSITKVTSSPCSAADPCYRIAMQLNNLSLAPTPRRIPIRTWSGSRNGLFRRRAIPTAARISMPTRNRPMAAHCNVSWARTPCSW